MSDAPSGVPPSGAPEGDPSSPLRLVDDLGVHYSFERSFKILERTLLSNRLMFGFAKEDLTQQDPDETALEISESMGMPDDLLGVYRNNLTTSRFVGFGVEEGEKSSLHKAYLEFAPKQQDEFPVVFLGFKWDPLEPEKRGLARYIWYPLPSLDGMLARLSDLVDPRKYSSLFDFAKEILSAATKGMSAENVFYLELTEEDNPRRSFDVNCYRANLHLQELYSSLSKICRHFAIPGEQFDALFDSIKTKAFGHVSGGIDRKGREFATIYYGVEYRAARPEYWSVEGTMICPTAGHGGLIRAGDSEFYLSRDHSSVTPLLIHSPRRRGEE
jgi:hypothetical protein